MLYFYLCVLILSATFLVTDMVLLYMEKIKNFGLERKLFEIKGDTIPVEKFLPENLTMLFVFALSFGAAGVFFDLYGVWWYFSLPISIMSGMFVCFFIQYFLRILIDRNRGKTLPRGDLAAGAEGYAAGEIKGEDYGFIKFEFNDTEFLVPALSANGTTIPEYERVIILFEENGFYFVQSIREVYDLDDE